MTKRTTGQLVSLAYVLHGAAESFAKPEVGTYKLRRQAERVMRNCINAIGSVGASEGLRMLQPRELFRAQGFPDSYVIEHAGGKVLTKTAQVRMCGNSVCPPMAAALVRANCNSAAIRRAEGF